MHAVARRAEMQRSLTHRQDLPHVVRWKALSRLRDCLTPLIHAAWNHDDAEIARLRRDIVDYSYIAEHPGVGDRETTPQKGST